MDAPDIFHPSTMWVRPLFTELGPKNPHFAKKQTNICRLSGDITIIPRSRTSTNWNNASSASGPLWATRLLTVVLESGVSVYALAFVLEADILSPGLNKDCVMWHVWQWLFWETWTVSHVCRYSVNHSNAHLITPLMAQSDISNFPRQCKHILWVKWTFLAQFC